MSSRELTAAPAGRTPRLFPLWMFWFAWHVARKSPSLACSNGFLGNPAWREAYDAGMSPEQAFRLRPAQREA
jgi:hypothetical protein